MNSVDAATFVLIHGAWQGARTWDGFLPALKIRRHDVVAFDLLGAGVHARSPASYFSRPLDRHLFLNERSPASDITQDQRTVAAMDLIVRHRGTSERPVILVAHSLGGVTATDLVERFSDRFAAVVYLGAYMVPPGSSVREIRLHASMANSLIGPLQLADPRSVGALRIDPRSEDAEYRKRLRVAFADEFTDNEFAVETSHMHCDEPFRPVQSASLMTRSGFGRVPRWYVRTLDDRAIPLEAQDHMISAVDAAVGGSTRVESIRTSHAAHLAKPDDLADILSEIARQVHGASPEQGTGLISAASGAGIWL